MGVVGKGKGQEENTRFLQTRKTNHAQMPHTHTHYFCGKRSLSASKLHDTQSYPKSTNNNTSHSEY